MSKTTNFDNQEVYILGDLNINLLDKSTNTSNGIKRYKEFCFLHGLKQTIKSPTRVTDKSSSLLDCILTNSSHKVSQHGVLGLGLSDHQLIYFGDKRGPAGGRRVRGVLDEADPLSHFNEISSLPPNLCIIFVSFHFFS